MRAFVLAALAALAACGPEVPVDPPVLRISGIPDQTPERVRQQHVPMVDRVCGAAGLRCQWIDSPSYEAVVARLGSGEIDLAFLGGATFSQAHQRHGAVPLVMRDVDFRFTSLVVVRHESSAQRLEDLRHTAFSFANRHSTSGHYMLRRRLADAGVVPERYFARVLYAESHDHALRAVAGGEVVAAGVNASLFYQRLAAGDPVARTLRVLWQTRPYVDYVWAARPQLSAPLRRVLTEAFLDLAAEQDADALRAENAAGYVPAFVEDFDEVRQVLLDHGKL